MTEDATLFAAWAEGDPEAGATLFDRHYPAVARYFHNKVHDTHVDDLVQGTFLAAVEGRTRFRGEGSVGAYLLGIAHNLLRAHYRKQRGRPIDVSELGVEDLGPTASQAIGAREEQTLLLQALRRIPIDCQEVLELFYWEALDTAAIAEIVEIPRGTVKSRLARARRLLEQALASLAQDPALLESTLSGLEDWMAGLRDRRSSP